MNMFTYNMTCHLCLTEQLNSMYHFICADGKVSIKALTSPARTVILYPNYSKVYLTLTVRSLVGKG